MACGTIGPGRLSEPERIVAAALDLLGRNAIARDLVGERILITVGATREEIDPVRFISNRSSGRMGFALAEAAKQRGAAVTTIAGVTTVNPPANIPVVRIQTAAEMHGAVLHELSRASIFIGAAAVADYRPASQAENKIKKTGSELNLQLERTPDILTDVARSGRDDLLVVGFAAETEDVIGHARTKLESKNLDLIVANDVSRPDAGFDAVTNAITIISRDRRDDLTLPLMSKLDCAHRILDEIVRLRWQARQTLAANNGSA
jgi:phosphopantothenoylcysteine decarboxylase/phosphopantothenate--cysteine ligase